MPSQDESLDDTDLLADERAVLREGVVLFYNSNFVL